MSIIENLDFKSYLTLKPIRNNSNFYKIDSWPTSKSDITKDSNISITLTIQGHSQEHHTAWKPHYKLDPAHSPALWGRYHSNR